MTRRPIRFFQLRDPPLSGVTSGRSVEDPITGRQGEEMAL
jgi:hypothetical protein